MDLMEYSQAVFEQIRSDFEYFARDLHMRNVLFIPISALEGDNVVTRSARTPWYTGPSLLEHLETVPVATGETDLPMRFPVQYVIRPSLDFRGYAGQLASGELRRGETVMVLPSGRTSRVKSIVTFDGELETAHAPMSVTVCLEDEIDVSRGDMLVPPAAMPHAVRRFEATVVWMQEEPLTLDRPYLLKHTTHTVRGSVTRIGGRIDVNTLDVERASELHLNEIGHVSIETHRPLFFDSYRENRGTGSFILIDPVSNLTVGAGMIVERERRDERSYRPALMGVEFERSRLTAAERFARAGHYPVTVWLIARLELAYLVERLLFDRGCMVHVLADDVDSHLLPDLAKMSSAAGLVTICSVASACAADRERARALVGDDRFIAFDPPELPTNDLTAAQRICRALEERGFIRPDSSGIEGEGI
jgi:hypothetical protein